MENMDQCCNSPGVAWALTIWTITEHVVFVLTFASQRWPMMSHYKKMKFILLDNKPSAIHIKFWDLPSPAEARSLSSKYAGTCASQDRLWWQSQEETSTLEEQISGNDPCFGHESWGSWAFLLVHCAIRQQDQDHNPWFDGRCVWPLSNRI